MNRTGLLLFIGIAAVLPILPEPLRVPEYWIALLNYIGLYAIVVTGLVMLTGMGGMTSFGQAAFVGIGAYATAVATTHFGLSPWVGLVAGLALTYVTALALGMLTMGLSGHFLSLGTLAWGLSLYYLFGNIEMLGKFDGLFGVPPLTFFDKALDTGRSIYYLIWLTVVLALVASHWLLDSRPGRAIRALKGGRLMAEAMGVNTFRMRVTVFIFAAMLAGMSGFLYAHMQRAVNPTPFSINYGIEYLFMAVIGGIGHLWGALIGAALLTMLRDLLQEILPALLGSDGNFELIVFGILMIAVLNFCPDGLWPHLTRRWTARRANSKVPAQLAPPLPRRRHPERGNPLLSVQKIRKEFGGLVAVNDVSFDVGAGEIVALIGPNGAGKSTLFNLVTGVLKPTSGQVFLQGKPITGKPAREIVKIGVSRTFQHVQLISGMSVLDNVAIGAHLRGNAGVLRSMTRTNRDEEHRLLSEAMRNLERVGLAAHADEDATGLPLGQQRILEIARALCTDPNLLLLDEPAAGLRYLEKQALASLLLALKEEGMSILLVEHDMDFVMNLADRIVVMEFGTRIAQGRPEEVRRDPEVLRAYLGGID